MKTPRFSWGDLESLITCDIVNGKQMYVGDSSRPNYLTWLITLNGASLSTDMAQRVVEIRLGEPTYSGKWEEELLAFITAQQSAILSDLVAFLQSRPKPIARHSRWGAWETAILSRLHDPDACAATIRERRVASDAEEEEGEIVQDYFASKLRSLDYHPDTADVFIPNSIVADWFCKAAGARGTKTTGVTRALRQLHEEGRLPCLVPYRDGHDGSRGFRWVGEHVDSKTPTDYEIGRRLASKIASDST